MSFSRRFWAFAALAHLAGCSDLPLDGVPLSKRQDAAGQRFHLGQRVPDMAEFAAIGPSLGKVAPGSSAFSRLVRCDDPEIVFKDEEHTGADRRMTAELRTKLRGLVPLVHREWPEVRLRVTEAWDEKHEHGENSAHYEGRAADITASDVDPAKLGRLARLAVEAGLDWVFYEDVSHVHVSVTH